MRRVGAKRDWLVAIADAQESHHDTLYCTADVHRTLIDKMSTGVTHPHGVDDVMIVGLTLREIPKPSRGPVAIVCQQGEVFPTTEDWTDA